MLRDIRLIICVLLFVAGLCSFMYPPINGARLEAEASKAAESFIDAIVIPTGRPVIDSPEETAMPVPYPELLVAMEEYNRNIVSEQKEMLDQEGVYAESALNLADFGVEGNVAAVLSIPKLELEMPIYLGASDENMAAGAAVLGGTSLPIGGTDSNCVLAGHRGWNGAAYFLNINLLQPGDVVSITNLWGVLNYVVTELKVIDPYSVSDILIQPGQDLLTLMTCDPPNSGGRHRLLVVCERIS